MKFIRVQGRVVPIKDNNSFLHSQLQRNVAVGLASGAATRVLSETVIPKKAKLIGFGLLGAFQFGNSIKNITDIWKSNSGVLLGLGKFAALEVSNGVAAKAGFGLTHHSLRAASTSAKGLRNFVKLKIK